MRPGGVVVSKTGELACTWCRRGFRRRLTGGRPQVFCSERCRRSHDTAGRRWVSAALADGRLSVDELATPAAANRAVHRGVHPPPLSDAELAAAAQRSAEAEQLIGELAAALVELEDDNFAVALRLFRPVLVRNFFAWVDRDREPEPTRMPATPRS